jgi:hypothetical protein
MIHHCELESWPYLSQKREMPKSRVLILTVVDISIDEFADFHDDIPYQYANLVINYKYAALHGYDMLVVRVNNSEYQMGKSQYPPYKFQLEELPSIYFVLRMANVDASDYDFVLFLDQSLSMQARWHKRSIDDFIGHWGRSKLRWKYGVIPSEASILMFNTGSTMEYPSPNVLLLRSSSRNLTNLIHEWWNESISIGSSRESEEDFALHHMVDEGNEIKKHAAYLQTEFVNWPCDTYCWICKLDNTSEHSEFLGSSIQNYLGMDRVQFSAALKAISTYHTIVLQKNELLGFIRNSLTIDLGQNKLKSRWDSFKNQVNFPSLNALISKSFVVDIFKQRRETIQRFDVNSFIVGSDFLFQDIFISESKVFFVSVPTADFHRKEEMEKSVLAYLNVAGSFFPMHVNVTCYLDDVISSNIIGELSHPNIAKILSEDSFLNISVNFGNLRRNFILFHERPRMLASDRYNISIFTLFKTDDAVSVNSFVQYYRQLGVEYFIFYIHGYLSQFPKVKELAKMYGSKGIPVTFAEWSFQPYWIHSKLFSPFVGIHNAQVTAMNSVLYRSRGWTKWLGFLDIDEYIYITNAKGCLKNKLDGTIDGITAVVFNSAAAYVNHSTESSFTLSDLRSANIIFENNLEARQPTKYFTRPLSTTNVIVHHPQVLSAGVVQQNVSTNFYLHFGFEHPRRSKDSIVSQFILKDSQ